MGPDQSLTCPRAGSELLWDSRHNGGYPGYPAHHLLQQVDYRHLQTMVLVMWGVMKEDHRACCWPSKSMVRRGGRGES